MQISGLPRPQSIADFKIASMVKWRWVFGQIREFFLHEHDLTTHADLVSVTPFFSVSYVSSILSFMLRIRVGVLVRRPNAEFCRSPSEIRTFSRSTWMNRCFPYFTPMSGID